MAKISIPIKISGIDVTIKVLKEFDDKFKFAEGVSEEYQNGFNDCKSILITALEALRGEENATI